MAEIVGPEIHRRHPPAAEPQRHSVRQRALSAWHAWLSARIALYAVRPLQRFAAILFALAIGGLLLTGWVQRDEKYLTAETGIGYYLGIAGSLMMLVLLLYPLRKRLKLLRSLGKIPHWFKIHMLCGIIGPVLILFHANFKLGSLNSSIALVIMLIVMASGIVGRYIYGKIHMGLYGRKAGIQEIRADIQAFGNALGNDLQDNSEIERLLNDFQQKVLKPPGNVPATVWSVLTFGVSARLRRKKIVNGLKHLIKVQARHNGWSWRERQARRKAARRHLSHYFQAVKKAAQFSFYDRLFSLWHILHLPLFILLVLAAIIHVMAVHLY